MDVVLAIDMSYAYLYEKKVYQALAWHHMFTLDFLVKLMQY